MEGIQLRGDINVCLFPGGMYNCITPTQLLSSASSVSRLGDPATGKSEMLRWVSKFLPCLACTG